MKRRPDTIEDGAGEGSRTCKILCKKCGSPDNGTVVLLRFIYCIMDAWFR